MKGTCIQNPTPQKSSPVGHERGIITTLIALVILSLFVSPTASARAYDRLHKHNLSRQQTITTSQGRLPVVIYAGHRRGMMQLAIANNGTFGSYGSDVTDPFTGERIQSCTYPRNDDIIYLWVGAFWIGAVVGRDTLVSTGTEDFYENTEFWAEPLPEGMIKTKSIDIKAHDYDPTARSEEDIIVEYSDTFTNQGLTSVDQASNRPHLPLGIRVTQTSMAWSYSYADDFILFDYEIKNVGRNRLQDTYMGIWVDGDVWHTSRNGPEGWNDDMVGFYREHEAPEGCGFIDTVNIAWTADNDGDPEAGAWDYRSARNVVGMRIVRTPSDSLDLSYNWWIIDYGNPANDFGPRLAATPGDAFRDFESNRLGTPVGDLDKYYLLRHKEFDYDLLTTALNHSDEGFLPPPALATSFAHGYDTRYLLSFGPFNIDPGQSLPISLAWVGGRFLHQSATAFSDIFEPKNRAKVREYYSTLNFDDLAHNSRWASWVYDNPGRDTDDDGYAGKFRVCCYDSIFTRIDSFIDDSAHQQVDTIFEYLLCDTFYYEGDGVPDFEGASPPPAPYMRVIPGPGKLTVRWNGYLSETTKDPFMNVIDFEGYRVYIGLDDRESSLSVTSSYDREDYNRLIWEQLNNGQMDWVLEEAPFSIEELRAIYDDPAFDPLVHSRYNPMELGGEIFYFEPQDHNRSDLNSPFGIHKVYPYAPYPGSDSTRWRPEDLVDDYKRPLPKYYEYEYVFENLLPTIHYHVAVTTFDYGSPGAGLGALETNKLNNLITEYAQLSSAHVEAENLDVYVYPNPYRVDGGYLDNGFEGGRTTSNNFERERLLHFAALPRVCTISIFSIDGDLIRQLEHNYAETGPGSNHLTWDLISRNTQPVVTGIYYYVVESETRTQIGKFVVIK